MATYTNGGRLGYHGDLSVNTSAGYFNGDPRDADMESLLGTNVDLSGDFGIIGAGIWGSLGNDNIPQWAGYTIGVGPGEGGSFGYGNTIPLWEWKP